ncbi:hypothetical protein [Photorhabdus tasmaniensis]
MGAFRTRLHQSQTFYLSTSLYADQTPLAQDFQKQLYALVFLEQFYQAFIRSYVTSTLKGKFGDKLIYRKRLDRIADAILPFLQDDFITLLTGQLIMPFG